MGSCAAPSAKGDDKFITTDYLQQCQAAYVIRLDGTTCLQLTYAGGIRRIKEGDPLQVASWYQACFDAGLPVTVQVNESRD
ncbi:hypothetical protein ACI3MC_00175 (plasmid) [Klebsiella pneumoniae]|uniref:hypothetical protein n=1 Tax=Klebsiella pneumoniae TaxID=573 RepID=UPI00386014E2